MFSRSRRQDRVTTTPTAKTVTKTHGRRVALASAIAIAALLATALPGVAGKPAPEKIFALEIGPNNAPFATCTDGNPANWASCVSSFVGSSMDMTARLVNRSPGGNSNFSSFDVYVPSEFTVNKPQTTKVDVSGTNGTNASATVSFPSGCAASAGCTTVRVGNVDTVKQNSYVQIAIRVSLSGTAPACGGTVTSNWKATAYTGQFSTTTFRQLNEDPALETSGAVTPDQISHYLTTKYVCNDAPVANDDSYSTTKGTPLTVAAPGVLDNDTDTENDSLTASLVAGAAHGTVALNADGSFTYTPNSGFFGSDSFTYKANDAYQQSNTATVDIDVFETSLACGSFVFAGDTNQVKITNLNPAGINCPPAVFTATFDGRQLEVVKPDGAPPVNLKVEIGAWDPEVALSPVPATQVSPPLPKHEGLWCDGSGTASQPYTEPAPGSPPVPETWCLESQSTVSFGQDATDGGLNDYVGEYPSPGDDNYGGQLMQVTEVWLLQGDALACRTCK